MTNFEYFFLYKIDKINSLYSNSRIECNSKGIKKTNKKIALNLIKY